MQPAKLHGETCDDAAQAIMTTDTFLKQVAVEFTLDGKTARLGAIAKGSGMIAPNMATMLGFLTTDAAIEQPVLQEMLRRVCLYTFNSITVDGDTSTNDMTLILANGLCGNAPIDNLESADAREFEKALYSRLPVPRQRNRPRRRGRDQIGGSHGSERRRPRTSGASLCRPGP